MRKISILIFIISLIVSCKDKKSTEIKNNSYNVNAIGKIKNGSYTFCGTVPTQVNYNYRIAKWSFITEDKIKIAEGEYDIVLKKNDSSGGCAFEYFENKIDLKKWRFWNIEGRNIEPTEQLIGLIESKHIKNKVNLK
ncbi:hypothetical protein [Aquimarina sp. SS2-1]|uniref:hypothetical protein n=1 Tax=Aquimarina besae TaxID=3342247 RepID=UPI0036726069